MNAVKSTLGVAAVATTALLAASIVKTPKIPESELSPKESTELQEQKAQEKEARTYYWNDKQSIAANAVDGVATTAEIVKQEIGKGVDKATDYPASLTAALVLETLGLAGAGTMGKKKRVLGAKKTEETKQAETKPVLTREEALKKYKQYRFHVDSGCDGLDVIECVRQKYEDAKFKLSLAQAAGSDGSKGYSPDGDRVYDSYSSESEDHYENRIAKLEREVNRQKNVYLNIVNTHNEKLEKMFYFYMKQAGCNDAFFDWTEKIIPKI